MKTDFQFQALSKTIFKPLMDMDDEQLNTRDARWILVDSEPGYPCRVSLVDASVGERVLALSFFHHDVKSPYRASGPIFVREHATKATPAVNEIPTMLLNRKLSIRAYNSEHLLIEAEVTNGTELESSIRKLFKNENAAYLHIHNASPGCFNCSVHRA